MTDVTPDNVEQTVGNADNTSDVSIYEDATVISRNDAALLPVDVTYDIQSSVITAD